MTLYELLSKLKTNAKVIIIDDESKYTVYADSINALDEIIKEREVTEWELTGGQSLQVTLSIISG